MNISFKVKSLDLKIKGEGKVNIEDMEVSITDVNLSEIPAIMQEVTSAIKANEFAPPLKEETITESLVNDMSLKKPADNKLASMMAKLHPMFPQEFPFADVQMIKIPCDDPNCPNCGGNQ